MAGSGCEYELFILILAQKQTETCLTMRYWYWPLMVPRVNPKPVTKRMQLGSFTIIVRRSYKKLTALPYLIIHTRLQHGYNHICREGGLVIFVITKPSLHVFVVCSSDLKFWKQKANNWTLILKRLPISEMHNDGRCKKIKGLIGFSPRPDVLTAVKECDKP